VIVSNQLSRLTIYFTLLQSRVLSAGTIISSVRTKANKAEQKQTAPHGGRQRGAAGGSPGWLSPGAVAVGRWHPSPLSQRAISWEATRGASQPPRAKPRLKRRRAENVVPTLRYFIASYYSAVGFPERCLSFPCSMISGKEIARVRGSLLLSVTLSTHTLFFASSTVLQHLQCPSKCCTAMWENTLLA